MSVKDFLVAGGYSKGDIITNPENESESYVVGTRGRAPRFLMKLAGVQSNTNKLKAAKKAAPVSRKNKASGGFVILTNGSFKVNGEAIYLSEDSTFEVPVGATISGP